MVESQHDEGRVCRCARLWPTHGGTPLSPLGGRPSALGLLAVHGSGTLVAAGRAGTYLSGRPRPPRTVNQRQACPAFLWARRRWVAQVPGRGAAGAALGCATRRRNGHSGPARREVIVSKEFFTMTRSLSGSRGSERADERT